MLNRLCLIVKFIKKRLGGSKKRRVRVLQGEDFLKQVIAENPVGWLLALKVEEINKSHQSCTQTLQSFDLCRASQN